MRRLPVSSRTWRISRSCRPTAVAVLLLVILGGLLLVEQSAAPTAAAGATVTVCYDDPGWLQPPLAARIARLQSDPRYRRLDLAALQGERIHAELGPFRSNSSLAWFSATAGLWQNTGWRSMRCSGDLRGKVEVWGVAVHFVRFDLERAALVALVEPQRTGLEIVQVQVPPEATILAFLDLRGTSVSPDVQLRPPP